MICVDNSTVLFSKFLIKSLISTLFSWGLVQLFGSSKISTSGSWIMACARPTLCLYSLLRACQSFCVYSFCKPTSSIISFTRSFFIFHFMQWQRNLKNSLHTYHNIEDCFLVNSPLSFLPLGGHLKHQGHTQILSHL